MFSGLRFPCSLPLLNTSKPYKLYKHSISLLLCHVDGEIKLMSYESHLLLYIESLHEHGCNVNTMWTRLQITFLVNFHFFSIYCSTAKFAFLLLPKRHAHVMITLKLSLYFVIISFKNTDTHSVYLLSDFLFAILISNYLNNELKTIC